jgi:hypothetical protein
MTRFSPARPHGSDVDYKYRAKVVIVLVAGCIGLWTAVALFAIHTL